MKKYYSLFFVAFIFALLIISCEDEGSSEEDKPYVGNWVSNEYMTFNLDSVLVMEQMDFTFTNTTFEDVIYQSDSLTDETLSEKSKIKGSIGNLIDSVLVVEIDQLSLAGGAYIDKNVDTEAFNSSFPQTLGKMLYESFSATYNLYSDGDSMLLLVPTKNEMMPVVPLRLGKQ